MCVVVWDKSIDIMVDWCMCLRLWLKFLAYVWSWVCCNYTAPVENGSRLLDIENFRCTIGCLIGSHEHIYICQYTRVAIPIECHQCNRILIIIHSLSIVFSICVLWYIYKCLCICLYIWTHIHLSTVERQWVNIWTPAHVCIICIILMILCNGYLWSWLWVVSYGREYAFIRIHVSIGV